MAETSLINNNNEGSSNKPTLREGFASCLRCGNTGVKDTFYGRGKQYCSQNCVKGTTPVSHQNNLVYQKVNIPNINNTASVKNLSSQLNHSSQLPSTSNSQINVQQKNFPSKASIVIQSKVNDLSENVKTSINKDSSQPTESNLTINNVNNTSVSGKEMKNLNKSNKTPNKSSNGNIQESQNKSKTNSFDWCTFLNKDVNFKAVPVSSFKHVPAANVWENLVENNLKIEIRNKDAFLPSDIKSINDIYWFATVIKVEGYYLLLRYEGYGDDNSSDFWINIYNPIIHPVGWSATQKKHLIPPKNIISKQADWKSYLTKNLIGAKTLPNNFAEQIKECLKSNFRVGMKLEVVDKTRISSVRLATINKIIGCRLHVVYDGLEDKDTGFWCNQQSPLIHPIGWAQLVGHELRATPEYAASSLEKAKTGCWGENDADFSYFPHLSKQMVEVNKDPNSRFSKGMKLEAIDPLNLSTICAATVTKVLRNNYVMVGIDGMMAPDGSDWFCYHASSGNIFPVGFSRLNGLNLTPPKDYNKPFNWFNYMKDKKAVAAPVSLFNNEIPNHGFKKGMYLEAVDLMEPRLICVAIIKEVVGRLLKIHFNGWDDSYDQWCDCESVELFPVGWCEIVGYPLEPPKEDSDSSTPGLMASNTFVFDSTIKKRGKHIYKGGRSKKRKRNTLSISDKDKLNGLSAKDEEDLLINYGNNDDQDNCTLFNSTIDSNEVLNDSNSFLENDKSLIEDKDNELTSNSTVSIKPSPILLNNQNMQILDQHPTLWTSNDVVNYFRSNDCGSYANAFLEHDISGKKLMRLTREDVWQLMENKLGPSLKVYALVEELKKKF